LLDGEHAWVTANTNIPMNLSKYGGAYNGALIDSAVQEYDIRTGRLLRSWDALDHIPPSDSYASLPTNGFPWDVYHVNSIRLTGNGNFIVSMRNTWAAYMVNGHTGQIEWTLGGRRSSFKLGPKAAFQWQHDVALLPGPVVTMFDDHCCQITGGGTYVTPTGATRALTLNLDQTTHTATLARQYGHGANFAVDYMGNSQVLPTGGTVVGWGSKPNFSEYGPSGKLVLDVVLPGPDITYRARLEPWVGLPLYPPAGAARRTGAKITVYASWNGATRVTSWRVVGLARGGSPVALATAQRAGFETPVAVTREYPQYEVQALDSGGRTLGTSRPFRVQS
jgi:hypothetical protein